MMWRRPQPLRSIVDQCIIIAWKEDVTELQCALAKEGIKAVVQRGQYTDAQLEYSRSIRCLIYHASAWRMAAVADRPTIIVEADFVPCIGFADLPLPFVWDGEGSRFAWLYSAGSIIYGIDADGCLFGHGNTTVAYVVTPDAARACLAFYDEEMTGAEPGRYRMWETRIGADLRWKKGVRNYLPVYQYGEHGGQSNGEHVEHGIRGWHEADILWRPLSFLPAYAEGSVLTYRMRRLRGWLRGWLRVILLRAAHPANLNAESHRGGFFILGVSIARMFVAAGLFLPQFSRKQPSAE